MKSKTPIMDAARVVLNPKTFPTLPEILQKFEESPMLKYGVMMSLVGTALTSIRELNRSKLAKELERKQRSASARGAKDDAKRLLDSLHRTPKTRLVALVKKLLFVSQKKKERKLEEEKSMSPSNDNGQKEKKKKRKRRVPGVDMQFIRRLRKILKIMIPTWNCREMFLLTTLSVLLVTRSFLSVHTARIHGQALRSILTRSIKVFWRVLLNFVVTGMFSSVINSGLKFTTNAITTSFRERLTLHVHDIYMSNRNYYKASVLRTGQLDNPDQRVVEDLLKFCETFSDLYSRTFKPALDVVVGTMQMAQSMGYTGPILMYSYFLFAATVVRSVTPKFSAMIARRAQMEGDFRRVHTRIIQNAEEIAFLEGERLEKRILNKKLTKVSDYASRYFFKQFAMGIFDQWAFKYMASAIGIPIIVLPFIFDTEHDAPTIASNYFTCNKIIQQASGSFAELLLVYKKFQKLSGFTARVMGLLEALEGKSEAHVQGVTEEKESKDNIRFEDVSIYSPDGRLLLKDLNLKIEAGVCLMITGMNGAGKTSLFRVLSGLWNGKGGMIYRPGALDKKGKVSLFYMPQSPYLVSGTLRDQVTYPLRMTDTSRDAEIMSLLLNKVGLGKHLKRRSSCSHEEDGRFSTPSPLNVAHHDWADVLSGGEKQRVGWARLFFHKPKFAILDEATAAINPDEESKLYEELAKLDVTFFSIAHRLNLRRFHQKELNLAGDGTGAYSLKEISTSKSK